MRKRSLSCSWALLFLVPIAVAQIVPGRYIVQLEGEPAAATLASVMRAGRRAAPQEVLEHRARVQTQQMAVRRAIEQSSGDTVVLDAIDTTANALIVQSGSDPSLLASIPGVRRVLPVVRAHLYLDHALPLHKAPEAWARVGGMDLAGLGVKIGLIDTGIDQTHPGFQDPSLPMPEGFPRVNRTADLQFTSNKVIVARAYGYLFGGTGDGSPRDYQGHGTGTGMVAAGVPHASPVGTISGVAPKAYLGSYNVSAPETPGGEDLLDTVTIMKAFDDAVADGMDVINMSLGAELATRPQDDIFDEQISAATRLGVVVVAAAGNEGPKAQTTGTPGTATDVITAGAMPNDRVLGATVAAGDSPPYRGLQSDGLNSASPITGPLFDVAAIGDQTGLACQAFPGGSLTGRIALIRRGTCTFPTKMTNAKNAGAIAVVFYPQPETPDPFVFSTFGVPLPALMVSNPDGVDLKQRLSQLPDGATLNATLTFYLTVPRNSNLVTSFSSRGPNPDLGIKPDVLAVGDNIFTAQPLRPSSIGMNYALLAGTSFSSPLVAGSVAVLRGFRPGLPAPLYRSLLINSATALVTDSGMAPVQQAGAGVLNLDAALQTTVAAAPASISFGAGGGTFDVSRNLAITNLGAATDTYKLTVVPMKPGVMPQLPASSIEIDPMRSRTIALRFTGTGQAAGEYQGFLLVQGTKPGSSIRIPYWYAVKSDTPGFLRVIFSQPSGAINTEIRAAIFFRVSDPSGVPLGNLSPTVTVMSGRGLVLNIQPFDVFFPGVYLVDVVLGPAAGDNIFSIQIGDLTQNVTITGTR